MIDTEIIYQQAPSGYLSILPAGTIIKINHTLLTWLGFTEEEVVNVLKFTDLVSKGGAIHYEMFFRPMVTINGNVRELNYELIRKDGSSFPSLISANALHDEDGSMVAVNIVVTDITQRNQYEKELLRANNLLKAEKEKFRLLAELSPAMIWTVNNECKVTYINRRLTEYFNLPAGSPDMETIIARIHPEDKKMLAGYWLNSTGSNTRFNAIVRLHKNDGGWEAFETSIVAMDNPDSDFKWFGSCISIDEHLKAMERKDEFINMANHELKSPVTILQGYLQLIQLGNLPEETRVYVSKSLVALRRFEFLISTLLNVSAINAGELKLNVTEFSLNKLLKEIIGQMNQPDNAHWINLNEPGEEMKVKADRERIFQVIVNLVNNAIKYSPGSRSVNVRLEKGLNGDVKVSVQDFGKGIAARDQEKIFERYYRVGDQKEITGLGLGLYISQNILEAHHSKLEVKSEVGKGSVFTFALPILKG